MKLSTAKLLAPAVLLYICSFTDLVGAPTLLTPPLQKHIPVVTAPANLAAEDAIADVPWLPLQQTTLNGCYVHAQAYIARLQALKPELKAEETGVITADGISHAIVIVRVGDKTYGRDEFIGTFPITQSPQKDFLKAHKAASFHQKALMRKNGEVNDYDVPANFALAQKILTTVGLKPEVIGENTLGWASSDNLVHVYTPLYGTLTAKTKLRGKALNDAVQDAWAKRAETTHKRYGALSAPDTSMSV